MLRLALALLASLLLVACSAAQPSATPTPTPTRIAAKPAYTPKVPRPTGEFDLPTAAGTTNLVVGNTGGDGVWLRRSPAMADKVRAWPDGTPMQVVGADTAAEGKTWKNVKDPAGNVGWIPAEYLVPPSAASPGRAGAPQSPMREEEGCLRPTRGFAEHLADGLTFPGGAVAGAQALRIGLAGGEADPWYLVGAHVLGTQMGDEAIGLWVTNGDPTSEGAIRGVVASANGIAAEFTVWPLPDELAQRFPADDPDVARVVDCVKGAFGR